MTRSEEANALPEGDEDAVLAFVRRVLAEDGDVTTSLVHCLAMVSGVPDIVRKVDGERLRWFRDRSLTAPTMPGPSGLE